MHYLQKSASKIGNLPRYDAKMSVMFFLAGFLSRSVSDTFFLSRKPACGGERVNLHWYYKINIRREMYVAYGYGKNKKIYMW